MDNTNFRGRERSNNLAGQTLQPPISQNSHRTPPNPHILTQTIENSMLKVSPAATEGTSRQSSKEPQLNIYYADAKADNKRYIKGEFKYTTKGDRAAEHRGFEGKSHPRGFKCQTTAQHGLPHVLRQTSTIGKFTKPRDEQEMMRHSFENEKQIDDEANPSAPLKENSNLAVNGRRGRTALTINQEFVKGSFEYTTKGGYAAYHRGFEGRCNPRGFKCQTTAPHSTQTIIHQETPIGTFVKMTDEQQMMRQSFEEHHQQDFDPPKVEKNLNTFSSSLVQNNNLLNIQPTIPEPIKNHQVLPPPIIRQPESILMNNPRPKESSIYTFEAGLAANNQKMIQNIVDSQSNQIKENLSNIPIMNPLPNNSNVSNKSHSLPPINPSMVEPKFYENYDKEDDIPIPIPIPNRKGKNQSVQNTVIIPHNPSNHKQQEADSPDTSFILTEFKKELMKVEPTLASTENQDSFFRNSNHISQILNTAPHKNHTLFSSYSTVAPRDNKPFKGIVNMEIERLNSDDSDAANDPTILEFRDALDQAIETSKMHHRRERSTVNPRTKPQDTKRNMTPHTRTQTHTRDTSLISTGNFLARDSNSTSFILPSGTQQYQDQRVNQTVMYDGGDSYDGEWDLNKKYNEAMQAKWKSQRGLQGQGEGALDQIKAVDLRSNKGHKMDILDYLK